MYLVRIGPRVLNLEFLVQAERIGDRPDWRVTMSTGITFDLSGAAGRALGRSLDELVPEGGPPHVTPPPGGSVAHAVDPATGARLTPGQRGRQRKQGR